MTMTTTRTKRYRKPRLDFPLFPHSRGWWAKKVRGKMEYFGKIEDDPKGERALIEWLDQKDNLLAGRRRHAKTSALTLNDLCNRLLNSKRIEMQAGGLKLISLTFWLKVCTTVIEFFGGKRAVEDFGPEDFQAFMETLANYAPSTRALWVGYVRALFTFAHNAEQRLIPQAVLFGPAFRKREPWHIRQKGRRRTLTAEEIRMILSEAKGAMRAMILLAINCGFGNNDCATLRFGDLDLENGWHSHPRPKTGVQRRCPLWNETVSAIREAIKERRKPKDESYSDLVFLTKMGLPYVRLSEPSAQRIASGDMYSAIWKNTVGERAIALLTRLGIKRKGLSFYSFRHTFETIGGAAKDQIAVDAIMGHVTPGMGTNYRESVNDERLQAVTDHVYAWLFPATTLTEEKEP